MIDPKALLNEQRAIAEEAWQKFESTGDFEWLETALTAGNIRDTLEGQYDNPHIKEQDEVAKPWQ